jgi:hypothetical protein
MWNLSTQFVATRPARSRLRVDVSGLGILWSNAMKLIVAIVLASILYLILAIVTAAEALSRAFWGSPIRGYICAVEARRAFVDWYDPESRLKQWLFIIGIVR